MVDVSKLPIGERPLDTGLRKGLVERNCSVTLEASEVVDTRFSDSERPWESREAVAAMLRRRIWDKLYGELRPLLTEARMIALSFPQPFTREHARLKELFAEIDSLLKRP